MGIIFDIPRLKGEQIDLCIRRNDDEALALYLKWMNDEEYNFFINKSYIVTQIGAEKEWMEKRIDENKDHNFSIVIKDSRRLIGNCGLSIQKGGNSGSLGICIGESDCWNKGYGTEVIKMLVKYGFEELNLHRLELTCLGDNFRAQKCYNNAGLVECGRDHERIFYKNEWHDLVHMEILRSKYLADKNK